jgi:hypothetical protein
LSTARRIPLPIAAVLAVAVLAPAARAATSPTPGLSPRLAAVAAGTSTSKRSVALSLPAHGPGSLLRRGSRLLVDVRVGDPSPAALAALRGAGASIVHVSRRYGAVTVAVAPSALRRVGTLSGVEAVTENLAPVVRATGPCNGLTTSEGDAQVKADDARATFGVAGAGVTVGILSDSFATSGLEPGPGDDIRSGDLPGPKNPCGHRTPVKLVDDSENGNDEGRALAQIVHDLAPKANLQFATAFSGLNAFADNIRALRDAGSKVIVDDVGYYVEPFFQNGPVGVAIDDVTKLGASYYTAAGNDNAVIGGRNEDSWETPVFRPTTCPAAVAPYTNCLDFDPGPGSDADSTVTVAPNESFILDLQWSEPWFGVKTDYDAYVVDDNGDVVAASTDDNRVSQRPFEALQYSNDSDDPADVHIVIVKFAGGNPRLKYVLSGYRALQGVEYDQSSGPDIVGPTVFGHSSAANATSVGAVPFDDAGTVEEYSSTGPATLYWGSVKNHRGPAPRLVLPQHLAKPDVVATDGVQTTFFFEPIGGVFRFYGTSAAAPHAAAVAALQLDAEPGASPATVRDAQRNTADAIAGVSASAQGAGLVNALGAVGAMVAGVSIDDVSQDEGDEGDFTDYTFTVTLSRPSTATVRVGFSTADGTAAAGQDYVARTGTLTFKPGVTTRTIRVVGLTDDDAELDETFSVNLSNPQRVTLGDAQGTATIRNDD